MMQKQTKIDEYFSLRPTEYSVVERLCVEQDTFGQMSLTLSLFKRDKSEPERLILSFSKVRNLVVNPDGFQLALSFLNIIPVDDQWEDVNFRVFEDEQGMEFSFICNDFECEIRNG